MNYFDLFLWDLVSIPLILVKKRNKENDYIVNHIFEALFNPTVLSWKLLVGLANQQPII